jgi:hypothetical protein
MAECGLSCPEINLLMFGLIIQLKVSTKSIDFMNITI